MQHVGIRISNNRYVLTDPMSAESVTVKMSLKDMVWVMENEEKAQRYLSELYWKTHSGTLKSIYYTFMNENPMWHIHGIVATTALVLGFFLGEETAILMTAAGALSLWALFKRVRLYKMRAAILLSLVYAHTSVWMINQNARPATVITSITLSLISIILSLEWSRKTYKRKNL